MFVIGISPIGTIPPFDPWKTIVSQYATSPILTGLILNINSYLDQTADIEAFFDNIFNVMTAEGYGLDIWGRIVGVNRVLQVSVGDWFGFNEALPGVNSFNFGSLYSGAPLSSNFALSDAAYRQLILAKAAANITKGSIPALNQILLSLFPGRGVCYVTDGQNMTMTYTFAFPLTALDLALIENSGVLPKSVGVKATIVSP